CDFFVYVLTYHRVLHSFPTRRSSDLTVAFAAGWWVNAQRAEARISFLKKEHAEQAMRAGAHALESYSRMEKTKDDAIKSAQARRSEEHTSELQSRENIVCRLLLEKKK